MAKTYQHRTRDRRHFGSTQFQNADMRIFKMATSCSSSFQMKDSSSFITTPSVTKAATETTAYMTIFLNYLQKWLFPPCPANGQSWPLMILLLVCGARCSVQVSTYSHLKHWCALSIVNHEKLSIYFIFFHISGPAFSHAVCVTKWVWKQASESAFNSVTTPLNYFVPMYYLSIF